jgi:hypothetical protein
VALVGNSFLRKVTDKARVYTNEQGVSSYFTDANLVEFVRRAWADVHSDINRVNSFKVRSRVNIVVAVNQREYLLPPHVATFLQLEKVDTDGNMEWEIIPRHPLNPAGPGFTIEYPILRFDPIWKTGETLRLTFAPTGEIHPFEATVSGDAGAAPVGWNAAGSNFLIPSGAGTVGAAEGIIDSTLVTVDTRANAYAGYIFRVLSVTGEPLTNVVQDRLVTSHSNTLITGQSGQLTIAPALSPIPALSAGVFIDYEVVPMHAYRLEDIVALKVARFMHSITGNSDRAKMLQGEFMDAIRTLRLDRVNAEGRVGHRFTRTVRNTRPRLGIGYGGYG